MAYLVLAVIVLLVIGTITTSILARHQWRWFHITAAIITVILAAIFPFFTAGSLKSRSSWHKFHRDLVKEVSTAEAEQKELKFGDDQAGGVGLVDLAQQLNRAALDAGRSWRNLRPAGAQNNQITLQRPAPETVEGLPAENPADADPAPRPPLASTGLVVYGFAESIDAETQQAVPSVYLGEYRVVSSTPDSMVITPVAKLNPAQEAGLQNAQQWTLYELLPLDSHEMFLAPGSTAGDDNILGRIDDELAKRTLANRVNPNTLRTYLEDGRRSQPDDPPLSRWMMVEFVKPYSVDVDDVDYNAPIADGAYFDGLGRAVDVRLKRPAADKGRVTFAVGSKMLLKQEQADELINDATAKLTDRFYLRPLNDYRFILRRIQLEVTELRSRIEELKFEGSVLTKSIDRTNSLIVVQQERKNKLEQDLAQFRVEREAVQKAVDEMNAVVAEARATMSRLHQENLSLTQRLEQYHTAIVDRLGTTTAAR